MDRASSAAGRTGSVTAYCDRAALGDAPEEAEAHDAVQVMTLHRAKGLEFDHVLLAGLEEGVWPNWQAEQNGGMAEERRLFYVGLTRARLSLRLSWVRNRRAWAGKPSRFLADIPRPLMGGPSAAQSPRRTAVPAARPAQPPPQPEVDRLVAGFMARKAADRASQ